MPMSREAKHDGTYNYFIHWTLRSLGSTMRESVRKGTGIAI